MSPLVPLLTALALGAALACFAAGLAAALKRWLATPSHPRHVLTPAPSSYLGVGIRLIREGVFFESLLRADPLAWLLGWTLHAALAVIAVQHLRYVVPGWWPWVEWVAGVGHLATAAATVALVGLWLRRLLLPRVRWITRPADHLWLAWLALLFATGAGLKYLVPVNVLAVKTFVQGVAGFEVRSLPDSSLLLIHLWAALILIGLFPFSKLLHGIAVWVNPTRASRAVHAKARHGDR